MWTGQTWAQVYPGFFLSESDSQLDQNVFVAFCSFFPCSLTVFIQGRQQKSGGRQQKSSRADKQDCFP